MKNPATILPPNLMDDLKKKIAQRANTDQPEKILADPSQQEILREAQESKRREDERRLFELFRSNKDAPKKPLWFGGKYIQSDHPNYSLALEKLKREQGPPTKKLKTSHGKKELSERAQQLQKLFASESKKGAGKSLSEILKGVSISGLRKAKENNKIKSDDPQEKLIQELNNFLKKTKRKSPVVCKQESPFNSQANLEKNRPSGILPRLLFNEESTDSSSTNTTINVPSLLKKESLAILQPRSPSKLNSDISQPQDPKKPKGQGNIKFKDENKENVTPNKIKKPSNANINSNNKLLLGTRTHGLDELGRKIK